MPGVRGEVSGSPTELLISPGRTLPSRASGGDHQPVMMPSLPVTTLSPQLAACQLEQDVGRAQQPYKTVTFTSSSLFALPETGDAALGPCLSLQPHLLPRTPHTPHHHHGPEVRTRNHHPLSGLCFVLHQKPTCSRFLVNSSLSYKAQCLLPSVNPLLWPDVCGLCPSKIPILKSDLQRKGIRR